MCAADFGAVRTGSCGRRRGIEMPIRQFEAIVPRKKDTHWFAEHVAGRAVRVGGGDSSIQIGILIVTRPTHQLRRDQAQSR